MNILELLRVSDDRTNSCDALDVSTVVLLGGHGLDAGEGLYSRSALVANVKDLLENSVDLLERDSTLYMVEEGTDCLAVFNGLGTALSLVWWRLAQGRNFGFLGLRGSMACAASPMTMARPLTQLSSGS